MSFTKFFAPPFQHNLLPAELVKKLTKRDELDAKRRELTRAAEAAEYAIAEAAKADTATRAAALLGKKAGTPDAEAKAREHLADLQREVAAYAHAHNTVTTEARELAIASRSEILAAIDQATTDAHARAVAHVDALDADLAELTELSSLKDWASTDMVRMGRSGRHPLITEAFKNLRTLLAPPAPALADEEPELAEDVA